MAQALDNLLRMTEQQGVQISGVAPTAIPGRGIGMRASRKLKKSEALVQIPAAAVRSLHTVPKQLIRKLSSDISVHGLLAAELTLFRDEQKDWASLVPTWADFEDSIPFLWPSALRDLLPPEAKSVTAKLRARFETDWGLFKAAYQDISVQDYTYGWLLVNTRTFYFETADTLKYPWHDRLALLPITDIFNHTSTGCSVSYSETDGYTVTADRTYNVGEEIFTSYGHHSNDFLLAEYGFLLDENSHDKICLDDVLLPKLTASQENDLLLRDHLGDFSLHRKKTMKNDNLWIALRLLCADQEPDWDSYGSGVEDREGTLHKAEELLPQILDENLRQAREVLEKLAKLTDGKACQRDLLTRRWEEIERLTKQAM